MTADKLILDLPKNSREFFRFQLGEFKKHKFVDLRIYVIPENGKDPIPTKKGLAIPPYLWPQFRQVLAQVEAALMEQGWLDREDLGG